MTSFNHSLIDKIMEELHSYSSSERVESIARSISTDLIVIGVTAPDQKHVLKLFQTQISQLSAKEKIDLAHSMNDKRIFELFQIACEIIGKKSAVLKEICTKDFERLIVNLDNWASVDALGVYVLGSAWRLNIIEDSYIHLLLASENIWCRRLAIVSTVALNQRSYGASGDAARTLTVCKEVLDCREDMIVKALSWALRKLSVCNKNAVLEFTEKYQSRLASRVIREVKHKVEKGTKN